MTISMFSSTRIVTVFLCFVFITGSWAGHFPLDDCSTEEIDLMFLYFEGAGFELTHQMQLRNGFVHNLGSFPSSDKTPRALFADVYDCFSANKTETNITSWRFQTSVEANIYGLNDQPIIKQWRSFQEIIDLKVKFVHKLFSEIDGVRDNATRVAVVFLNCAFLQYGEWDKVPRVFYQQGDDTKIFFVGIFCYMSLQILHHNNTLLLGRDYKQTWTHVLYLAICNQCKKEWFSFKHSYSTDFISCYNLIKSDRAIDSLTAGQSCMSKGGFLATIESRKELIFIRTTMYSQLKEIINLVNDSMSVSFSTHIGLRRDQSSDAKRFQWGNEFKVLFRPVVVNNWKPGKPSLGYSGGCGVWEFAWNETGPGSNEGSLVDGWVDVECETNISAFSLCEVVLPRKIDFSNLTRIRPASDNSFNLALSKGNLMNFGGIIVSLSADISENRFLFSYKMSGREFPLFDCGKDSDNPRLISYMYVCDHITHCCNRWDEIVCVGNDGVPKREELSSSKNCSGMYCCDGSCLPLERVNDGEVDCAVFQCETKDEVNDEAPSLNKYLVRNETCAFICNNECVHFSQLNDSRTDCSGPEGFVDEILGKLERADTCHNKVGQYSWAPKCVYVKVKSGAVLGCRDMSHIKDCADFECPDGYFKCPRTYCIPQHYVLDGKVDCPTGEDEQIESNDYCFGNFKCWKSKICLHPDKVCDGLNDCPERDDEKDCDMSCVEGFKCVSGTLTVSNYNRSKPILSFNVTNTETRYLDMSGVDMSSLQNITFPAPDKLLVIVWSNCTIHQLDRMFPSPLKRVYKLDLSYNHLRGIKDGDLWNVYNIRYLDLSNNRKFDWFANTWLLNLETLDLSYTRVTCLDMGLSTGRSNIYWLNLSFSRISLRQRSPFSSKSSLQTLDLRGVVFDNFSENFLNGLAISQHLYTDSFELCCPRVRGPNISSYVCHSPDNSVSSCFDLLRMDIQRVLLWVAAVLAVVGNIAVIVYRVVMDRSVLQTGYGLFVTNLGVSDFIMGVYLFIIAGMDYYYRGVYILYDRSWRESIACRFAGFLATLSCEVSTLFIFFISLDRFLKIKFPFGQVEYSKINKIITVLSCWIIGFLLALFPVIFRFEIYSSNAMCLGLPLTTTGLKGWDFSFGVFVVLNCFLCIVIACGQRAIFRAMLENRIAKTASNPSPRRAEDLIVAKQLFLVAMTNFLCWFPVGVMGFLSVVGYEIGNDVYAWTTVIVIPVNSAANPLLYTIPALMNWWEKFKFASSESTSSFTKNIVNKK